MLLQKMLSGQHSSTRAGWSDSQRPRSKRREVIQEAQRWRRDRIDRGWVGRTLKLGDLCSGKWSKPTGIQGKEAKTDLYRKRVKHVTNVSYVISPLGLSFSSGNSSSGIYWKATYWELRLLTLESGLLSCYSSVISCKLLKLCASVSLRVKCG